MINFRAHRFSLFAAGILLVAVFLVISVSSKKQETRSRAAELTTPTANAVRVVCNTPCGTGNDTAKFQTAITAAVSSSVRFADGPGGQPQAVVYVPPGTYRLLELTFPSNLRMEVDAGTVLEQAGGTGVPDGSALIRWDGPVGQPLQNVSIVGVNSSTGGIKTKADPVASGRSINNNFTFNMDPAATNANNKTSALMILNTKGFLVENVFSIENDYLPTTPPTDPNWYPTSQKAVLGTRARSDSPCGGPFAEPTNGIVSNWYNIAGPKGYGPNQVEGVQNVSFSHIFTQGGTALRLETDSSEPNMNDINAGKICPSPNQNLKFGEAINGLVADDIEGLDCNRAVSFTPHLQNNSNIQVTNVKSTDCAEAVVISRSPFNHEEGSFTNSSIANIAVAGGNGAQLGTQGSGVAGYWSIGDSLQPFSRDPNVPWDVIYSGQIACSGTFQQVSDLITPPSSYNSGKPFRPVCPGVTNITSSQTTPTSIPTNIPTQNPTPTLISTPIPSPTIASNPTPAPGSTLLSLTLLLHGIGEGGDSANPSGGGTENPIHHQRTVSVVAFNNLNVAVATGSGTVTFNPDPAGNFQGTIDMGTKLTTGDYTVKVTTPQYLTTLVSGPNQMIAAGTTNNLAQTTLVVGDINGDNVINILDYNILIGCYSDFLPAASCTPANNTLSDLNDDGAVNQFDYNLFLRELNNRGGQ